jgi:mono/diheme cytochrome c family protein
MHWKSCALTLIAAGIFTIGSSANAEPHASNQWLTGPANHEERFERLESYLRGFDQPMWEVGERYEKIHAALLRNNHALAAYHWIKIKVTIENGIVKRPARGANAQTFLLSEAWARVLSAFESDDATEAWQGFARARSACIACHDAEGVAFVNNQAMFELDRPK